MTAIELMHRHTEAWVRAITLERKWTLHRDEIVRLAVDEVGPNPVRINDQLRRWQNMTRAGIRG